LGASHDASPAIKELCARIVVAQRDEIGFNAERASGDQRRSALTQLGSQLDGYASGAMDAARVRALAGVVRDLSKWNARRVSRLIDGRGDDRRFRGWSADSRGL
jgi:hypothetical protein